MKPKPLYLFPFTEKKTRKHPCALCRETQGNLVGLINYFGLEDFDMIQCPSCGLVSPDPIPSEKVVNEGCSLLYSSGYGGGKRDEILRGFIKSYRRGSAFARRHLKDAPKNPGQPLSILEVGAGDGYFSSGIKAELPHAKIWLMDVVEDLIRFYYEHHDCKPVLGQLETAGLSDQKFDLIIFRDLLEHVRDPFQFLKRVSELTQSQGQIYFITPNGKEDFWLINQRFLKTGERSLLLLNHFHYFLPETLTRLLQENGFAVKEGFKFGLKQYKKGLGHKEFTVFNKEALPEVRSAQHHASVYEIWKHVPEQVQRHFLGKPSRVSRFYSAVFDRARGITPFASEIGHEFSVLAEKI